MLGTLGAACGVAGSEGALWHKAWAQNFVA